MNEPTSSSSGTTAVQAWEKAKKVADRAQVAFEKQVEVGKALVGKGSGKVTILLPSST